MLGDTIKIHGLSVEETNTLIPPKTIFLGYRGSIAHGLYVPNSDPNSIDDKDIMGICFASENCYLGLSNFEQLEKMVEISGIMWDAVVYEIRKFFKLLLKQNPNVISFLWMNPTDYIYISEPGQKILDNRDLFTSKECYHSFIGYAKAQLAKMTHYSYQGYMGAKRKALVEKNGFDTKNAAHLIRLLRMGIEYLTDGQLRVKRTNDACELLAIKRGEWSLEKVKSEAEKLFDFAQEAFIHSPLPVKPNFTEAEKLVINLIKTYGL